MSRLARLRSSLGRLRHLLAVALRHGAAYTLGPRLVRWPRLARRLPAPDLTPPERLRVLFEDLGGTFVKFGQMLALQPDLVSLEYCNALFKLLDQVDPFPYSEIERICREELGRSPEEIFDRIERQQVATASVAQVHVAWLGEQKVAFKVQRPNVEVEFGSDIRLMLLAMAVIRTLRLKLLYWLLEPMTEFVAWTEEELDFRYEARYAEQLRRNSRDNPVQYVPKIYAAYTTRRTLVIEFLEGATLLSYLRAREEGDELKMRRLEPPGFDRKQFAANIIDNFLGDAFEHGMYHADLHPGNLMILPQSVVGYIDFGITGVMSRHARRHLVLMTLALAEGDMDTLHEQFLRVSAFDADADPLAFRLGLDVLALQWYGGEPGSRRLLVNFTRIMGDMLTLSRQTGVLPERDIVKYIRSSIAIDGLATRFEPDFDVGEYLARSCSRYLLWQDRRNRYSPDRFLDWSAASGKLLRDGPARASRLLDRFAQDELPLRGEEPVAGCAAEEEALRLRALQLAGAAFVAAVLTAFTGGSAELGFNLQTAQLAFVALAAALLGRTLYRLA